MNKSIITFAVILAFISCTKENTDKSTPYQAIPASEFEALKNEVEQLKAQVAAISPGNPEDIVSVEEFNALKQENEQLKTQIGLFTSGFFMVDGLRFDKNGTLISLAKIEDEESHKVGEKTLTTTRTYDAHGRLIQIYRKYSGGTSITAGSPYYWQKEMYEYNGMTCKVTTQTYKFGLPAGTPYEEEIVETTYW